MPATVTDRLNGILTSTAIKPPCIAVALTNITLSGLQTVNSVALEEGDRVLVTAETDPKQNGIYNASTSDWQRAKDFDGNRDVVQGTLVLVRNNVADGGIFEVTTPNPIIIGTSNIIFDLHDDPAITYDQTLAEIAAGATIVNSHYPELWVDRYGTNTIPGTTDMTAAFLAARDVAEVTVATKNQGAQINCLGTSYLLSSTYRQGWYVHLVGRGPGPTRLSWTDAVTGKCVLFETVGGSYVFGSFMENIFISGGNNARWVVFSQGSHQHCGLRRCAIENVNQIGMEFGSLGGPARMNFDDIWIEAGSQRPITTTLTGNFITGNTVLTVASTTGFVAGAGTPGDPRQRITMILDSGVRHNTTVAAVNPGVSVTLTNALPSNASTGQVIRASRIGAIINSGSNNEMGLLDIEGDFDKGLAAQFGNFNIGGFHTELTAIGIALEQAQVNNSQLVQIFAATGSVNNPILIDIESQFIGSLNVLYAAGGQSPASAPIRNQVTPADSPPLGGIVTNYSFSTTQAGSDHPALMRRSQQFYSGAAGDWLNRADTLQCAFPVAGRIYAPWTVRDVNAGSPLDAVAIGVAYDTTTNSYEIVLGAALSGSGTFVEKLRIGKDVITAVVPIRAPVLTVATLPAASAANKGGRAMVTDANATTFNGIVAGGGANNVPVFSDGANWRIG